VFQLILHASPTPFTKGIGHDDCISSESNTTVPLPMNQRDGLRIALPIDTSVS